MLFALGLAALVLGLALRSVALELVGVSKSTSRYQALLQASQTLEQRMEDGVTGKEEGVRSELYGENAGEKAADRPDFKFKVEARPVTSDPRVEQVEVRVDSATGGYATLSAYRLRIRRGTKKEEETSPSPDPAATASAGGSSSTSSGSTTGTSGTTGTTGGTTGGSGSGTTGASLPPPPPPPPPPGGP